VLKNLAAPAAGRKPPTTGTSLHSCSKKALSSACDTAIVRLWWRLLCLPKRRHNLSSQSMAEGEPATADILTIMVATDIHLGCVVLLCSGLSCVVAN
jgi:hypothetical protein